MIDFSFSWNEAYNLWLPLVVFVIAMVIYAIIVFKFYHFLARKDIFKLNLNKYNTAEHPSLKKFFGTLLYIIEYIIVMPIISMFWFGILAVLLAFLSKDPTASKVLLISIAVVSTVRICAYYNEDLSNDLAKMLPFALLAIMLIDITYFNLNQSINVIKALPSNLNIIFYYTLFVIGLEFIMRIIDGIATLAKNQ